jgi:hypothetical protein
MNLSEKIMALYPNIALEEFVKGNIVIQNDSDGKGDYIAKWSHPDFPQPTKEQLDAVK